MLADAGSMLMSDDGRATLQAPQNSKLRDMASDITTASLDEANFKVFGHMGHQLESSQSNSAVWPA